MAVSVRMDPLMEKELELAAKRKGVTKSQFIIEAVERALGRKDPYALLMQLKAEEARPEYDALREAFKHDVPPADADARKDYIRRKLKAKHGLGTD